MHALVARRNDAAAALRGRAFPRRDDAAGAGDDRDQRHNVVRLDLGFDDEVDVARRQHAIGVTVAAVARQLGGLFDFAELRAVGLVNLSQIRSRREPERQPFVEYPSATALIFDFRVRVRGPVWLQRVRP